MIYSKLSPQWVCHFVFIVSESPRSNVILTLIPCYVMKLLPDPKGENQLLQTTRDSKIYSYLPLLLVAQDLASSSTEVHTEQTTLIFGVLLSCVQVTYRFYCMATWFLSCKKVSSYSLSLFCRPVSWPLATWSYLHLIEIRFLGHISLVSSAQQWCVASSRHAGPLRSIPVSAGVEAAAPGRGPGEPALLPRTSVRLLTLRLMPSASPCRFPSWTLSEVLVSCATTGIH